jgi:parallel beta-helix repeat protein
MRGRFGVVVAAVGATMVVAAPAMANGGGGGRERLVDNDKVQCPKAQYVKIQDAVNAAQPGDRIVVCPGTYPEQVTIPAGKDRIALISKQVWKAIIQAPTPMLPPNAIVRVNGAKDVGIAAFTIQGPGTIPGELQWGVRVDSGGSAAILGNHITHIRDNPFSGGQHGIGVLVGRASEATTGSALISANLIDDYQKGGIVVSNAGSRGTISYNRIKGVGPSSTIAANGVQISSGADGNVNHNDVSGNVYTPATFQSIGIFSFSPGKLVVEDNVVHDNDGGIVSYSGNANTFIRENSSSSNTYDGIELDFGDGTTVRKNRTFENGLDGVGVYQGETNALILANRSTDNTEDGLLAYVDAGPDNVFRDNVALRNATFDCEDQQGGTTQTWIDNIGPVSSPPTICRAESSGGHGGGGHGGGGHGDDDDHGHGGYDRRSAARLDLGALAAPAQPSVPRVPRAARFR